MKEMPLKNLKIGYGSYSRDFSVPGDRRRFAAYAKHKNITIEYADPSKEYDLVYLTYNSDMGKWIDYKKKRGDKCKVIFELIDSYLAEDYTWKSVFRGAMNYLNGRNSKFYIDYRKGIIEMCSIADAIVCSTEEQKLTFLKYNSNVHISLDIFSGDIENTKNNFKTGEKLKIVWEGQPHTLHNVLAIKNVLNEIKEQIEFHIVTDPQYYKFSNKYIKKDTADLLKEIHCEKIFYPWQKNTFSEIITQCDLAIIPIKMEEKLSLGKPENKLILLWQMGIPVLVSPTPAYERVLKKANVNMLCYTNTDWLKQITSYKTSSEEYKKNISTLVKSFASTHYSPEKLYEKWDTIFSSVF
jgi:hypothetical protein